MEDRQEQAGLARKLGVQQLDLAIRRIEALPALPSTIAHILEVMRGPGTGRRGTGDRETGKEVDLLDRIAAAAALDPAAAARLLSLANAAPGGSVRTIPAAVSRLGAAAVRSAVLAMPVAAATGEPIGLDAEGFWRHSVAAAVAAAAVAEALGTAAGAPVGKLDPEEAYACALLHDIGKQVLAVVSPKSYARAAASARAGGAGLAECERETLGLDHTVAGRRLAQRWLLPSGVENAIWLHHQPPGGVPDSLGDRAVVGAVALADAIVRRAGIAPTEDTAEPPALTALARRAGLDGGTAERIAAELPQRLQRVERELDLPCGQQRYARAIAAAAADLAAENRALREQAAAAAAGAAALERFGAFTAELPGAADLADVLAGVAEAFLPPRQGRGAGDAAVAYAFDERDGRLFAVCCNGKGPPDWRSLAGSAGAGAAEAEAGAEAPRPAAEAFVPLLADADEWAPWPELGGLVHQPLSFAGRRLGGVLYSREGRGGAEVGAGAAMASAMAMALALVQQRCRAAALSEELAGASQRLAESQQALAEARTLEAVGDLAAGAAHELNNPLAVVSGRAQLMRERAAGDEERKVWEIIVEQSHRVSDIISDLMEFASPRRPRPAAVEPAALLHSAAEAFANSAHPQAGRAKVDIEVGEGTGELWADAEQVRSVLVELISNAAAAAADPHIRLKCELDESGQDVLFTVRDNGSGMDAAVAARVYTPFFSVQRAGRRRGLGLPKAKRYVEINGGRMRIVTRPGDGTTVFVRLPRRASDQ